MELTEQRRRLLLLDQKNATINMLFAAYNTTKSQENVGLVMRTIFGVGNVDLLNRPTTVTEGDLYNAGWSDAEQGSTNMATVYSNAYWAGSRDIPYSEDLILHVTPIKANGTILSPSQLDAYVEDVLLQQETVEAMHYRDKPSNNGHGVILWIQKVTSWDSDTTIADNYDEYLHLLQEGYYATLSSSDYPTTSNLATVAAKTVGYNVY